MSLSPVAGFLVNDPAHSPFGADWLRGITPARVGVLVAVCFIVAFPGIRAWIHTGEFAQGLWQLWDRFGRTLACATPMFILVIKTEAWTARSPAHVRVGTLLLAVVAGAAAYTALRGSLRLFHGTVSDPEYLWEGLVAYFFRSLFSGGLLTAILYCAIRERDVARELHRTRLARVDLESQLAESRLKLLRAQIEPHFLFNSLASVKRLYESDRVGGRSLLDNLAGYLRIATLRAKQGEIALGEEVALAKTFLGIFQVRMGQRLRVRIEVPAEHDEALVPPLVIGTLIENAIKHGLGPRGCGGTVSVTAHRDRDRLVVAVGDDGVGFLAHSGYGIGLANIRARLETMFGAAGSLELASNPGGGVTATLRLPYRVRGAP